MTFNWPIVGHKKIVKFLQKTIEGGKTSQAYLFYGPENLGKKSVAKFFSQTLICEADVVDARDEVNVKIPCGKCQNCQGFLKNIHPDVVWIRKEEDKKDISIDQIRDLKEKISLTGFTNGYKVIIIVNAEEMNNSAANSFLKMLEEPPKKSVIILLANNLKNIPETILSRCQLLKFSLVAKKEIVDYLKKEHKLSVEKADEIASLSLGHPGQAIKFLNDKKILEDYLEKQKKLIKIIESSLSERLKIAEGLAKDEEIKKIITGWKNLIRDLILLKTNNEKLLVNLTLRSQLKKITEKFSFEKIYQIEKELNNLNLYLNQNINLRLALDNFVINL